MKTSSFRLIKGAIVGRPPDKWILVDRKKFELHFLEHGRPVRRWPIGIGKPETPTPTGNYRIYAMQENPQIAMREEDFNTPETYGTRNIDLSIQAFDFDAWVWRHFSIHGTDDDSGIGTRCSLGCIRMRNADIEELYELVSVGMLVMIV